MTKKTTLVIVGLAAAAVLASSAAVYFAFRRPSPAVSPAATAPSPAPAAPAAEAPARLLTLRAYFLNNRLDPEVSCTKVFPVERTVPETKAVGRAALEELLKGPTEAEKADGYSTAINPGVGIKRLTIENGTARAEFDEQLEFQVGGSCRVAAIRWQIVETLKQFPTVKDVIISIDGRTEDILQP